MAYTDDFFDDGEHEFEQRLYLNLRGGYIAQTQSIKEDPHNPNEPDLREVDKWEKEGYKLDQNENKAGKISFFMAKRRNPLQGYVTSIKWYMQELRDRGVTLTGWKVVIETPKQAYQLQIGSNDRAFSAFMNSFLNCDYNRTIKFNGYKKDGKKNLLLYQGDNNGKDFIHGKFQLCYQEPLLQQKLEDGGVGLTEEERKNVVFGEDGLPKLTYPYVTRSFDGKWDFSAWNKALKAAVLKQAVPAIEEANAARDPNWKRGGEPEATAPDDHADDGYPGMGPDDDEVAAMEAEAITTEGNAKAVPATQGFHPTARPAAATATADDDIPF